MMIPFKTFKGSIIVIFKGQVKDLEEFSMYIKKYPKNFTVEEYIEKELELKGGKNE